MSVAIYHIDVTGKHKHIFLKASIDNAEVKIEISLTSKTSRRSLTDAQELVVTTTIANADVLTIELSGEKDNGTILKDSFRSEHSKFYDLTKKREVLNKNAFPSTCDPRFTLQPYSIMELRSLSPHMVRQVLDRIGPTL